MHKNKRFLIVGLGPIGGILASHLAASGNEVYGVDVWEELIDTIKEKGIHIKKLVTLQANLSQACLSIKDLKSQEFDYVVITVKTPYMKKVVPDLKELTGKFNVVAFQNGLDNEEYLAEFFPRERVLRVVVNYAGNLVSPGIISMSFFHKPNYVGGLDKNKINKNAEELAQVLTNASLETEPTEDIKRYTWKKAILNAILAPLSALLGMTMVEVMECEETRSMVELLFKESLEVAKKVGYDFGKDFYQQGMKYLSTAGHHKPSMLIDIEKGNPTEIDFINAKIAYYGQKLNIPTPYNTAITSLVKAKEKYMR
jgi:2-dehydropantoate 2-reductase